MNAVGRYKDLTLAFILFISFFSVGSHYYSTHWRQIRGANLYAEEWFIPAVSLACGNRLTSHVDLNSQYLIGLMSERNDSVDCRAIHFSDSRNQINAFQFQHFYLVAATGLVWKIWGLDWKNLRVIAAGLLAGAVVSAFLLFRAFFNTPLSFFLTLLFGFSPSIIFQSPSLRDFSRVSFITFGIAAVAHLSLKPLDWKPRVRLGLAGLFGVALGFGTKMRPDHILAFGILLAVYFAIKLISKSIVSRPVQKEFGLIIASFVIFAYVIPYPWSDYSPHPWDALLSQNMLAGQMNSQTLDLGIEQPAYELGFAAEDPAIVELATVYHLGAMSDREGNAPSLPTQAITDIFWKKLVVNFPADLIIRAIAAIRTITVLPFLSPAEFAPLQQGSRLVDRLIQIRKYFFSKLFPLREFIGLLGLWILAVQSRRHFMTFVFLFLPLAAYQSLRFQWRHFFVLESFGLVLFGSVIAGVIFLFKHRKKIHLRAGTLTFIKWGLFFTAATLSFRLMLAGVRIYQTNRVKPLVASNVNAKTQILVPKLRQTPAEDFFNFVTPATRGFTARLIKVTLSPVHCPTGKVTLNAQIEYPDGGVSRQPFDLWFPNRSENLSFFYPAYYWRVRNFKGFAINDELSSCLVKFEEVVSPVPLPLLILNLPEHWDHETTLYQKLGRPKI